MYPNRHRKSYFLSKNARSFEPDSRNYGSDVLPDASDLAKQLEDEQKSFETALQLALDVSVFLLLNFVINVLFYRLMPIVRNGFFCNDTTIRLPFKQATFPWWPTLLVSLAAAILLTAIVELCHYNGMKSPRRLGKWQIPEVVADIYKYVGLFLFGYGINFLIVTVLQRIIGRLRPNFYHICEPVPNEGVNCSLPEFAFAYVSDFTCRSKRLAEDIFSHGGQSFPSCLVASVSYAATYVIFVLQYRWAFEFGYIFKPMLQISLAVGLMYIAATQVTDNLHHWADIMAGLAIGVGLALFMFYIAGDIHPQREAMKRSQKI